MLPGNNRKIVHSFEIKLILKQYFRDHLVLLRIIPISGA